MAEIDDLYDALAKADKAGNTEDAYKLADHIRSLEGAPKAAPAAAPKAAPKAPSGDGGYLDMAGTTLRNAADSATFGAINPMAAFIASGLSRVIPGVQSMSYAEARQRMQQQQQEANNRNPGSALVGQIGGSLVGGLGLAKGAMAASRAIGGTTAALAEGAASTMMPQAAEGVGRTVGRMALGGAAGGVAEGLAQEGVRATEAGVNKVIGDGDVDLRSSTPISDTFGNAAGGALGGAAFGAVAKPVGNAIMGAVNTGRKVLGSPDYLPQGFKLMARKLGIDPDTMSAARNEYRNLSYGQEPSIAQIMDMRQQGVLRDIAAGRAKTSQTFADAADDGANALPGQVRGLVDDVIGRPRTASELEGVRDAPAKAFMDPIRESNASSMIRRNEFNGLMRDRFFSRVLRSDNPNVARDFAKLQEQFGENPNWTGIRNGMSTDTLDRMRSVFANPSRPWSRAELPDAQRIVGQLERIIERTHPGYKASVVDDYAAGARRLEGFEDGRALKTPTDSNGASIRTGEAQEGYGEGVASHIYESAGKREGALRAAESISAPNMQEALGSAYGAPVAQDLGRGAQVLARGQRSLEAIAPSRIAGDVAEHGNEAAVDAGAAVVKGALGHGLGATYSATRAIKGSLSSKIPDEAVDRIAKMMVSRDPNTIAQAERLLRRAGADDEIVNTIRQAAIAGGGAYGGGNSEPLVVNVRPRRRQQ